MNSGHIDDIACLDKHNFWFRSRQRYINSLMVKKQAKVLDIGCGSGGNMLNFAGRGHSVLGIDKDDAALAHCQQRGLKVVKMDLDEGNKPKLDFVPDYITALDCIEHIKMPVQLLKNLRTFSTNDTRLIITVPAYSYFWSEWDVYLGHVKRYSPEVLRKELQESGWELERLDHIHFLLVIPALLQRKILQPLMGIFSKKQPDAPKFFDPGKIGNILLYWCYAPEFILFDLKIKLPAGLSILAVARPIKKEGGIE